MWASIKRSGLCPYAVTDRIFFIFSNTYTALLFTIGTGAIPRRLPSPTIKYSHQTKHPPTGTSTALLGEYVNIRSGHSYLTLKYL